MSKFEVLTGMAFAAFADAPVDAAVLEVGLGGSWDATNVADAKVAVVGADRRSTTSSTSARTSPASRRRRPASSSRARSRCSPSSGPRWPRCCCGGRVEVDATVARAGLEFGVLRRDVAVGGQLLKLQGLGGAYDEIFLPLHGTAPGGQRGARARGRGGVLRRRRTAHAGRRTRSARASRRWSCPAGWSGSGRRRACSSTPRTTRTARRRWRRRWTRTSGSATSSASSA